MVSNVPARRTWRRPTTMLLVLACLVIQAISATASAPAATKHAQASAHQPRATAARILPPALNATAKRSRQADRALVARAKGVKRCVRANPRHLSRCKSARRALQRAGAQLARVEHSLAILARTGGKSAVTAKASGVSAAQAAPTLTVSGLKLSWNKVDGINTYVFVIKIPGQTDRYGVISGSSATPPAVPGFTVKYSLRTTTNGSIWATERSITYPAAKAPEEVKAPAKAPEEIKTKAPEEVKVPVKAPEEVKVPVKAPEEVKAPEKVNTQAAPELIVSGQKLVWNTVPGVSTYVLATIAPGQATQYSQVSGTSFTPPAVAGTTIKYGLRTAVEGALWATEVSISYPAGVAPTPPVGTPTPPVSTPLPAPVSTTGKIIGINDLAGWGPGTFAVLKTAGIISGRVSNTEELARIKGLGADMATTTAIIGNVSDSEPLASVNTASWAAGTLAEAKTYAAAGVTLLEVGNEMYLKGGAANGAKYAEMYVSLHNAVQSAGLKVTLLSNSGTSTWMKEGIAAEPKLTTLVDAFSDHPYGVAHEDRNGWEGPGGLEAQHTFDVSLGFTTQSYYLTEYGLELTGSGEAAREKLVKEAYVELTGLPYVAGIWWYQSHSDSTGNWGVVEGEGNAARALPTLGVIASFEGQ